MVERLLQRSGQVYRWYATWRDGRVARFSRAVVTVVVVAACAWFIWKQASSGLLTLSVAELRISPYRLLVSWLCITAATVLGAWEWVLLLNALGGTLAIRRGMSIHLTSMLSKYLPGMIWPYAGKVYLATREGVRGSIASLSVVGEFAILYSTGALLMLLCLPFSGLISGSALQRAVLQGITAALAAVCILSTGVLGQRWASKRKGAGTGPSLLLQANWLRVAFVMVAVLATWWLLGVGFSVLYGPATAGTWQHVSRHTFVLAAALLMGQIAFFLPTGLGLREAILVALLASGDDAAVVVVLAVLFRVQMLAGELLAALLAVLIDRLRGALEG
jgi:glycosyltransferase 2 family protein